MRTKTIRQWSYEDVRLALLTAHGPITGIKIANETGFIVEECPAADQPRSPKEPELDEVERAFQAVLSRIP